MTATAFYLKATILKTQNYLKILFHIKFLLTFLSISSQKKKKTLKFVKHFQWPEFLQKPFYCEDLQI